jgi:hypothetical protein
LTKPIHHARSSVERFGGAIEDYLPLHDLMDETKASHGTIVHRAIYHSSYGIYLVEKILGHQLVNADGHVVAVRDVAEQHVLEDLGFIPSLDKWLSEITAKPWMAGLRTRTLEFAD